MPDELLTDKQFQAFVYELPDSARTVRGKPG
jgi:hypothetical protein